MIIGLFFRIITGFLAFVGFVAAVIWIATIRQGIAIDDAMTRLSLMSMIRLIGRATTIFALCLAVGLHWTALQSFAWTIMLVSNAKQSSSLAQAVAKTFDGNHPCGLCKGINAAQHSQKKSQAQPAPHKPDLMCSARVIRIAPSSQDFHYAENTFRLFERGQSPPVPPPRAALA